MIKAIFLDMDDTLVVNNILYVSAELMLFGYLRNFGITHDEARAAFDKVDKENFKTHGYSKTRMPASFEAVLKHFVPEADEEMVKIVRDFAEEIFTARAALKPGVAEAIDILSEHYQLYIVTAGDHDVQRPRYENNIPFKDKIADVFIVPKKDKAVYADVLNKLGLKAEEVVMIGDSLKSDIVPAVEAGLQAVWVETFNSTLHEAAQGLPSKRAYKAASLLEAACRLAHGGSPAPQCPAERQAPKVKRPKQPRAK